MPPSVTDRTPREGDERFITITGRRPAIECAFASVAEGLIPVRRGASVGGWVIPACRAELQTYFHSFSLLTLPSDAGTWSVTVFISSEDQALKKLRDPKH